MYNHKINSKIPQNFILTWDLSVFYSTKAIQKCAYSIFEESYYESWTQCKYTNGEISLIFLNEKKQEHVSFQIPQQVIRGNTKTWLTGLNTSSLRLSVDHLLLLLHRLHCLPGNLHLGPLQIHRDPSALRRAKNQTSQIFCHCDTCHWFVFSGISEVETIVTASLSMVFQL